MNRNIQSSGNITAGLGSDPVIPEKTSIKVGCSVNVNTVASTADHTTSTRNAIHGTPGWKYRRDVQSSRVSGERNSATTQLFTNSRAKRSDPRTHPTSATPTRTMPAQKSQMTRSASHHESSIAVMNAPRPERKGNVYSDSIVHHMPTMISRTGSSSTAAAIAVATGE